MNLRLLILVLPIVFLGVGGCVNREAQAQAKRTSAVLSDPVALVRVEVAKSEPFVDLQEITGSLTSADDTQIGAKVPGRLIQVLVKDGDSVSAGQLLAVQDSREARTRLRQAQSQLDSALASLRQAQADAVEGPRRSSATVRAARAQLASAEAQLLKARNGARSEERRQAEAQLTAATTNLEIAKKDLDRGEKLLAEGAISQRDFDRFRQQHAGAVAQFESARETVRILQNATRPEDIRALESQVQAAREQLQTALSGQRMDSVYADRVAQARAQVSSAQDQIDLAQQGVGDAEIRAPFAGRIAGKPMQIGTYLGPGTPFARLVGTDGIYFEGDVPEVKINQVQIGMPVTISLDALPGRFFSGTVAAVNPQAESLGRLFRVRVMFAGAPADLKAGMFARGKVELSRSESAITVPSNALISKGERTVVFVVSDGKAVERQVTRRRERGDRVEVEGLNPGDNVVIRGQQLLQAGATVRVETDSKE